MLTKLTLSLHQDVIKQAKQYAEQHHMSLSRLVEIQLKHLIQTNAAPIKKKKMGAITQELLGVIELPENFSIKKHYTEHLMEKYKNE